MAIQRKYNLVCDGCGKPLFLGAKSVREVRRAAMQHGWRRVSGSGRGRKDGRDLCPKCKEGAGL